MDFTKRAANSTLILEKLKKKKINCSNIDENSLNYIHQKLRANNKKRRTYNTYFQPKVIIKIERKAGAFHYFSLIEEHTSITFTLKKTRVAVPSHSKTIFAVVKRLLFKAKM